VDWQAEAELSFRFRTNAYLDPRSEHHQEITIGLASGWESTGPCAPSDGVDEVLSFTIAISRDEGEGQELRFGQVPCGNFWNKPYPESADNSWHKVVLVARDGGSFGLIEVWYDDVLEVTAELCDPLPETLFVYVEGRSLGMVNIVDDVCLSDQQTSIESRTWGSIKGIYR